MRSKKENRKTGKFSTQTGLNNNTPNNREHQKIRKYKIGNAKQQSLKEKLNNLLELPDEIILDMPRIIIMGKSRLSIENHKGMLEFEENLLKLNTGAGILVIKGQRLLIREITSESLYMEGLLQSIEFLR